MELFQRIEFLIGKKLPLYPTEEQEVQQMGERVAEAQRYAKLVRGVVCHRAWHIPGALFSGGVNSLRQRQNGRYFADDTFKLIFVNENVWIPIEISLKFVSKGPIDNIPALV